MSNNPVGVKPAAKYAEHYAALEKALAEAGLPQHGRLRLYATMCSPVLSVEGPGDYEVVVWGPNWEDLNEAEERRLVATGKTPPFSVLLTKDSADAASAIASVELNDMPAMPTAQEDLRKIVAAVRFLLNFLPE